VLAWIRGALVGCAFGLAFTVSARVLDIAGAAPLPSQTIELDEPDVAMHSFTRPAPPPYRATWAHSQLYLAPFFHAVDGRYDLVVQFHGMGEAQEHNIEGAHLNAAIVTVNYGAAASGRYEHAFKDSGAFPRLLTYWTRVIERSGRAPRARVGRIAVSAWSAGYGAVASLLRQPANAARLDAILLEDGIHSDWADKQETVVDNAPLAKYARVAEAAMAGDKLFGITHSSIRTEGYPSTTQTTAELLRVVGLDKVPRDAVIGSREMHELYEVDRGDFHVKGFTGGGVKDHVDHLRGLPDTLLPYLKRRWER